MSRFVIFILTGLTVFSLGCSVTTPRLSYSGGNYNSVTDDLVIYEAGSRAISQIVTVMAPFKEKNILLVQVVNNAQNDYLADRIFEELQKNLFKVGTIKGADLTSTKTDRFDYFLMFYPVVYGTETRETRPSGITRASVALPFLIPFSGQILAAYTFDERQAGVYIHCRLTDAKTGEVKFIQNLSGQSSKRIQGGLQEIIFPK